MPSEPFMRLCVYCGSNTGTSTAFTQAAEQLGSAMAHRNIGLVYGGGHVELMGILAGATLNAGGEVVGVITEHLVRAEVAHQNLSRLEVVPTMHERKARMNDLADGFVVLPGGFGTVDEFAEAVTWNQLGLIARPSCCSTSTASGARCSTGWARRAGRLRPLVAPPPGPAGAHGRRSGRPRHRARARRRPQVGRPRLPARSRSSRPPAGVAPFWAATFSVSEKDPAQRRDVDQRANGQAARVCLGDAPGNRSAASRRSAADTVAGSPARRARPARIVSWKLRSGRPTGRARRRLAWTSRRR